MTTLSMSPFQSYDSSSGLLRGNVFNSFDSIHLCPLPRFDSNECSDVDLSVPAESKSEGVSPASVNAFRSYDSFNEKNFDSVPLHSLPRHDRNENTPLFRSTSGNSFMRSMLEILSTDNKTDQAAEADSVDGGVLKHQLSSLSNNINVGDLTNSRTSSSSRGSEEVQGDGTICDLNQALVPHTPNMLCQPTDSDVLLGRGGRSGLHPGNKRYLLKKDAMQGRYKAASKNAKKSISQELVNFIQQECKGRFLKCDESTGQWYEIDNEKARTKCSQALRDINTVEVREDKRRKYPKKTATKSAPVKKHATTKYKYTKKA